MSTSQNILARRDGRDMKTEKIERLIEELVDVMGWDKDINFYDTPKRFAKWLAVYQGLSKKQIDESLCDHFKATFPTINNGLVVQDPIKTFSMCPHHMLLIEYDVYIGYVPEGKAIGLSKLSRIAIDLARYPWIQEDYTSELANVLHKGLNCKGVMVVCKGIHNCMRARGVKQPETVTTTSSLTGVFAKPPEGFNPRQEFLDLLNLGKA